MSVNAEVHITEDYGTYSLVNFIINVEVIFNWHGGVANQFTTVAIYGYDICHAKHDHLFVLVNMQFLTHVCCMVGHGIQVS